MKTKKSLMCIMMSICCLMCSTVNVFAMGSDIKENKYGIKVKKSIFDNTGIKILELKKDLSAKKITIKLNQSIEERDTSKSRIMFYMKEKAFYDDIIPMVMLEDSKLVINKDLIEIYVGQEKLLKDCKVLHISINTFTEKGMCIDKLAYSFVKDKVIDVEY